MAAVKAGWVAAAALAACLRAAAQAPVLVVDAATPDLAAFERAAERAQALGATYLVATNDLPLAQWEFDTPGDPYPAWYAYRPSLLKVFVGPELRPYVDGAYADSIVRLLEARCAILRRHGLKGAWSANEPQVLPEGFFAAHPELRGPRVDQPNRSRVARFAPCTDEPETLRLYRESMERLLAHCPEITFFSFLTTDSGSGFCWVPGLYPGKNGPEACRNRPMPERVAGFLKALQEAGAAAGHPIEVAMRQEAPRSWMEPSFADPMEIVRLLPRGLALDNREGPDGRAFSGRIGAEIRGGATFYPIAGLSFPGTTWSEPAREAPVRATVVLGDTAAQPFAEALVQATRGSRPRNAVEHLAGLRAFAATLAGEKGADDLLAAWLALNAAQDELDNLNFGPVFRMGTVLGRWITRPLVPFPEDLTAEEKRDWRPYLFQAKGESQALDLVDIQAMRMYEGWGAHLLFQRVAELTEPKFAEAARRVRRVEAEADPAGKKDWELLADRIEAADILLREADNVVAYQAQLDRVKALGVKPEENPVLGAASSWDRTDLQETARKELDNTARLLRLLQAAPGPLFDTAETEGIMALGPNLAEELRHKLAVMNAHWEDYGRLFTQPNP